ncbi:PQQ-binding-like beta-propeller repeat protein [Acidobacteriota bacterium]
MKKTYLVLSLILLLGGCSVFKSKVIPYPEGIHFPVEKAGGLFYDGEIIDQIQKKEGRLYFSTREGFIYCIDSTEYKSQWRLRMPEAPKSPIFMGRSYFFVFDAKNNIYCYDLDGNTLWQMSLEEEITSPLAEIGNYVFLGTSKGSFIAIDALSGNEAWRFAAPEAIRSNPVEYERHIIFGCDDHQLYFIDQHGNLVDKYLAEDKILNSLLVDRKFLYFGTENNFLVCLDLKKKIKKWEVKTGGRVLPVPVSDKKRVFFLSWNNVLYCLHKRNGSILWWRPIPSRSLFPMELYKDKIVVSSLSSRLVCFNVETGARIGEFDVGKEMMSNPLWSSPFLLVNVYDQETEKGELIQMKKVVQSSLESSVVSPQIANQEILLSVTTVGFHLPQYEFYIRSGEEKNVVQATSDKSTWAWFPSQPGTYTLGVIVSDEKINQQSEIPFVIETKATLNTFRSSLQEINEEIIFSAGSEGFIAPQYEFQISRVNLALIGKRSVLSIVEQNKDDAVMQDPESGNWIWTPTNRGLYRISFTASDDTSHANVTKYFLILTRDELINTGKYEKAVLESSQPSPQGGNRKIIFNAASKVFDNPEYELRISRVNLALIGKRSVISTVEEEMDDSVLSKTGSARWMWTPKSRGLYRINLIVSAGSERAYISRYFSILTRDELEELSKLKKATLNTFRSSLQEKNKKIIFDPDSEGFFAPKYEFRISRVNLTLIGKRSVLSIVEQNRNDVVLEDPESGNWIWTPTNRGLYRIILTVSDHIDSITVTKYFLILTRDELKETGEFKKAILEPSQPSPQEINEEIIFSAGSEGFLAPQYELRISRVNLTLIGKRSVLSIVEQNGDDVVLEDPESGNWIWTPTEPGLYVISLFVTEDLERAAVSKYFLILTRDELKKNEIKKERAP